MKKLFLIAFAIAGITELLHGFVDLGSIHFISKSLLIPTLAAYYVVVLRGNQKIVSKLLLITLLFTWVGDMVLIVPGDKYFMFGLVAFLLAHILYIFVYRQHKNENDAASLRGVQLVRLAFPIVLAGSGLVVILYPHLGGLRLPVMIYALVITVMTLNALFRYDKTTNKSFYLVFAGAVLFMISDSVLAISKFMEPIEYGGFWIMLTYIAAQFTIVKGLIAHQE